MLGIRVDIVRFVDPWQPGVVECRFVDASGKDHSELKAILPNVADRLNLPPEKKPVKIANN